MFSTLQDRLDTMSLDTRQGKAAAVGAALAVSWGLVKTARCLWPALDREMYYHLTRVQANTLFHLDALVARPVRKFVLRGCVEPRPGDDGVSVEWLTRALRRAEVLDSDTSVVAAKMDTKGLQRGFIGAMCRLSLTYSNPEAAAATQAPSTVILKMTPNNKQSVFSSVLLGTFREAWFYETMLKQALNDRHGTRASGVRFSTLPLPRVFYAHGCPHSGRYVIMMEDLAGSANPLEILGNQCWGQPRKQPSGAPSPVELVEATFTCSADMHAAHWCDEALLRVPQLEESGLWQGRDRARHDIASHAMAAKWSVVRAAVSEGGCLHGKVSLPELTVATMDASVAATSWKAFRAEYNPKALPFTLTHGDFHAANSMWLLREDKSGPVFLDWAAVSVHHGATELAQYLVSNATIEFRREHEMRLLKLYWNRLIEQGVDAEAYPFEFCVERYRRGGIERWLQMLTLMLTFAVGGGLPPAASQWFVNQVSAFVADHAKEGEVYPLASIYCLPRGQL